MMPSPAEKIYESGRIPVFIAAASILQISESLLPHPVPGLRFGLANIVSLLVLIQYGFKPALTVTLLRTVVSSFILGTFLSPGFILSFAAGCASISTIGVLSVISARCRFLRASPIGLSIAGAFVHNMVQLYLAYLMLFNHPGIFFLVPWLAFGSVILGGFSGLITSGIIRQLNRKTPVASVAIHPDSAFHNNIYQPKDSRLHRCAPEIKIASVLMITAVTVLLENLMLYGFLIVLILILIPMASLDYPTTFRVLKKLWVIILSAFILPLYFNQGSLVFIETGLFSVHQEALILGCIFSTRIIILALLSSIVAQTTHPKAFTRGIRTFIKPLDRVGANSSYIAHTISLSLTALPELWHKIRSLTAFLLNGKKRNLKTLKTAVTSLFVYLFSTKNDRPR
jgi:heptaprenyl diphosphate synthase